MLVTLLLTVGGHRNAILFMTGLNILFKERNVIQGETIFLSQLTNNNKEIVK